MTEEDFGEGSEEGSSEETDHPADHPPRTTPDQLGSRTAAIRRAVYLCLTRDGMHQRGVAARLKLPKTTVLRALRFLLAAGAIVPHGATPQRGAVTFYQTGPKAAAWLGGGPGGPGGSERALPKPLLVQPHSGTVRIDALSCPKDPTELPGLVTKASPNGAPIFWFRFEGDGGLWSAQLNVRKDGGGTLMLTAPAVTARLTELVLDGDALRARAQKAAIAWGQRFGLELARERDAPRIVHPQEWAMPMPGLKLQPTGRPGVDRAFTDGSHPDAIETQEPGIVRKVGSIVDDQDRQDATLLEHRDLLQRLAHRMALAVGNQALEASIMQMLVDKAAVPSPLVALLSQQVGAAAASASSPRPLPDYGVDVS